MAPHDPLFKQLLKTLFADFLALVAPDVAARLDGARASFVSEETLTAHPVGDALVPDLVVRVPLRDPEDDAEAVVHVEIERDHRSDRLMGQRMWTYTQALELRDRRPVLPIVLYLRGGSPVPVEKTVPRRLPARALGSFGYLAWGLSRAPAERYLDRPEPLAWAFAALMRPPDRWSRVEHCLRCALPIAEARLGGRIDGSTAELLLTCVHTYLELDQDERKEYEMARAAQHPRLEEVEVTYADRLREEGRTEGLTQGRRQLLTEMLEGRFGPLSPSVREKLDALASEERLDRLARKLLVARSLEDLGLA